MHTKLTLRLKQSSIQKAKAWAKRRRVSLSQAVETIFDQLPEGNGTSRSWSPWMECLFKLSKKTTAHLSDAQAKKQYHSYLERKHR